MSSLPRRSGLARVAIVALGVAAVAACGATETAAARTDCNGVELLVAASDYSSSLVCGAPGCEEGPSTAGADLGNGPQLSTSSGRTFFLSRDKDLIFELDPKCGTPVKAEFSVQAAGVGKGSVNPHDVAVAPDGSLFVVLYNVPKIVILKDGKIDDTIDLSMYDGDNNPQAESIRIVPVNGVPKAFVTLERLDDNGDRLNRLLSKQDSYMLRIDVASRVVEETITLAARNPFNTMAELDGALFLAAPGNFDAADEVLAGIERFDTATSTTKLFVTEKALGGSVAEVAVTDGCGVAIVASPTPKINPTSLVTFDPKTGQVLTTAQAPVLGPTSNYDLQGLTWRGGSLYVGDRRQGADGYPVRVFDRDPGTCNLHEVPERMIKLLKPPVALRPAN